MKSFSKSAKQITKHTSFTEVVILIKQKVSIVVVSVAAL